MCMANPNKKERKRHPWRWLQKKFDLHRDRRFHLNRGFGGLRIELFFPDGVASVPRLEAESAD